MSPDSDVIKWIAFVAALVQTVVSIIQLQQPRRGTEPARSATVASGPLLVGLGASLLSLFVVALFGYLYERRGTGETVYYEIRSQFENATVLRLAIFLGLLLVFPLGVAAITSNVKGMMASPAVPARLLVHVLILSTSTIGLVAVMAQEAARSSYDTTPWVMLFGGAVSGFFMEVDPAKEASSSRND
ncbi:hypothetical protein [Saccharopolyspora gloriosae]|uniref:hypothetical protein n=1 Tax=Saccharopolyspora gloriosae TaxID=455344 RepID=UPI001FB64774|nr:hypothetical protein [Saccharopolyspora gloriosae]